jgi:hypothetical protein
MALFLDALVSSLKIGWIGTMNIQHGENHDLKLRFHCSLLHPCFLSQFLLTRIARVITIGLPLSTILVDKMEPVMWRPSKSCI